MEGLQGQESGTDTGFRGVRHKGDHYVIKLDPIGIPQLATAAEAIATRVFYAIGYHTPENYIVSVDPANLVIEPGTTVEDSFGDEMTLTEWRFRRMIREVPLDSEGRMRVTASKYIPGTPLGPFRYYETRSDDPNDVFRHEDRRELRGLRLFAAWLNHDDSLPIVPPARTPENPAIAPCDRPSQRAERFPSRRDPLPQPRFLALERAGLRVFAPGGERLRGCRHRAGLRGGRAQSLTGPPARPRFDPARHGK